MKAVNLISVIFVLILQSVNAQVEYERKVYIQAFEEQLEMLQGKRELDFKRAVFLTENAFHRNTLDYSEFCQKISSTGIKLKELIKEKKFEKYTTAGNWAVFSYLKDSIAINNFQPFQYDFNDFMGNNDWTKMFVTKLMNTKSGNCHSLPYYYKILCEEIGAKASLVLAPNHLYIKHFDETGRWTNIELTNGGFPSDQWIIKQMSISIDAIKNEVYMNPLSQSESIAFTLFDLINAYYVKFGNDAFTMQVTDTALHYFPKCIPLIMTKSNLIFNQIKNERAKTQPDETFLEEKIAEHKKIISSIYTLGHKDVPTEIYEEWVKSTNTSKNKQ